MQARIVIATQSFWSDFRLTGKNVIPVISCVEGASGFLSPLSRPFKHELYINAFTF